MPKISELPLTINPSGQDLIVIVNNNTTKSTELSTAISGGFPNVINANVSIKTDTKANLETYIPALGVMSYATDEGSLRVGDGINYGGKIIESLGRSFVKYIPNTGVTKNLSGVLSLDPILQVSLPNPQGSGLYKGRCAAYFSSTSGVSSPVVGTSGATANQHFLRHNVQLTQLTLTDNLFLPSSGQPITIHNHLNLSPISIENLNQNDNNFYYECNFDFISTSSGVLGCVWGSNGIYPVTIYNAILHIERMN